jgi:DNA-binding protein HU-beta
MQVNKTQLVDVISAAADLPKTKAAVILDTILDEITRTLVQGEQVALVGFGTFTVKKRAARTGRDPRTGGVLQIPETMVVAFKAGKGLKDAVNEENLQAEGA